MILCLWRKNKKINVKTAMDGNLCFEAQ